VQPQPKTDQPKTDQPKTETSDIEQLAEQTQEALRRSIERSEQLTRDAERLLERARRAPSGGGGPEDR
jgi:hypothetical protein